MTESPHARRWPFVIAVLTALSACAEGSEVEPTGGDASTGGDTSTGALDGALEDATAAEVEPGDDTSIVDASEPDGAIVDTASATDARPEAPADAADDDAGADTALTIDASAAGDAAATDTDGPDTGGADTGGADSGGPDSGGPDSGGPDTGGPDSGGPDTGGPDTGGPDTGGPVPDASPTCPTGLVLGNFTADAEGWTFDSLWRRNSGSASMVAGSTTSFSSSYTQNLSKPVSYDLSGCASATLGYSVQLADDPDYTNKGPDKSERLFVQCSGDGGTVWNNLVPTAWPANQSACATSYCCGGPGAGRSFPLTAQTATLPAACRTATARFRFQAKGSSVWNLQNPGWYVDTVRIN